MRMFDNNCNPITHGLVTDNTTGWHEGFKDWFFINHYAFSNEEWENTKKLLTAHFGKEDNLWKMNTFCVHFSNEDDMITFGVMNTLIRSQCRMIHV